VRVATGHSDVAGHTNQWMGEPGVGITYGAGFVNLFGRNANVFDCDILLRNITFVAVSANLAPRLRRVVFVG
jgi:hypothetical protein